MKLCLVLICVVGLVTPAILPTKLMAAARTARLQEAREPQDLERFQGYFAAAPDGMDVWYAWSQPGGRGENVRVIDIEVNWNTRHGELKAAVSNAFILVRGVDPQPQANLEHGTAVLGIIAAAEDGFGISGIANGARFGLINPVAEGGAVRIADAIDRAVARLRPGDILLIEQQSLTGPRFDPSTGRGLAPIEVEQDVFDAIKRATARGIVVIEPAGNGFENLDDPAYGGKFDRARRDSGAIMVGAGMPPEGVFGPGPDRTRTEESNYGSRVDVQGWGRFVTTSGYGDLRNELGKNGWYTTLFGATSAAAAMVAGAAAVLQSIAIERGHAPLTSVQMRRLLASTGTPQTGDTRENIGPRPNLKAAVEALDLMGDDIEPLIGGVRFKPGSGKLILDGLNFRVNDAVVEIDGVAVTKLKFPADFRLPGNISTRIVAKGVTADLIPPGATVSITVLMPSSGRRSEPFLFTRP